MSSFIGILLDVSGSMRYNVCDGVEVEEGTWARSIFTVIDDLVKYDVSRTNHVFAVAFGSREGKGIFDILSTIQYHQQEGTRDQTPATHETIEDIFRFLEDNGARTIRNWAEIDTVTQAVSEFNAKLVLEKLTSDNRFRRRFVEEFLPRVCRDLDDYLPEVRRDSMANVMINYVQSYLEGFQRLSTTAVSSFRKATTEEVKDVVQKSKMYTKDYSVQEAADIIHGCLDEQDLTNQRARELLNIVEPYIYGYTPIYSALEEASKLFSMSVSTYSDHHKLLFILSDGYPTDNGNIRAIQSKIKSEGVKVVGCYISSSSNVEPKKLHNVVGEEWEKGAKFLFDLSSTCPTELVMRAVFIKYGWTIDIRNNNTKLFMHVNHPEHMKDACKLARNAVCSQDALADLLASVSLDIYINQKNTTAIAHEQIGGTCYANASAAVLHLAMSRILGRDDGYPEFEEIRDDLINKHGSDGANTFRVLQEVCPMYRLHCKEVDVIGAMKAITKKRPAVAKFRLTDHKWSNFKRFYQNNPSEILKKEHLDIGERSSSAITYGHAVVLTSYNSECLRLMNSWGENWGDMGFFRVENADVLGLEFIDVSWTKNDLSPREKDYYWKHGSKVADKLMRSLEGLQVAKFTCPLCKSKSKVTDFSGCLSRVACPKCQGTFSTVDGEGNILALNMYLISLIR